MAVNEQSELIFFDTFSHESNEELNLDLVQFPKSVFVSEIRIIPLGARVQGDFPGGVRLGATNPGQFHVDFFVNDLSKPGACTFHQLGGLDYCQNGPIHLECLDSSGSQELPNKVPTDGLVLKGWYSTITLAVYGNLTQVLTEASLVSSQPPNGAPPQVQSTGPGIPIEVAPTHDWASEAAAAIPTYTGGVAQVSTDMYDQPYVHPQDNYDGQMYRHEYYDSEPPKDPRYQLIEGDWDKDRRNRDSPLDRERERRRTSVDRRSRSRVRDRSRDDRRSRSRSHSRYRVSRSHSHSLERRGTSADRDWDRSSYKRDRDRDDYRRHRDTSYDRTRGTSYDKRSPSYDRRSPFEKRSSPYDRKPFDKRGTSYERRASSYEKIPYEKRTSYDKRHSPYRIRESSLGSRSPSRDDPRRRPRSPETSRRPLSPEGSSSPRPDEPIEYDIDGKPITKYYGFRHDKPIRSPSEERNKVQNYVEAAPPDPHSASPEAHEAPLKTIESPPPQSDQRSIEAEPFEPILSDEDICDDLEAPYIDIDYDPTDYCGVDDIIKYYNPFKSDWVPYVNVNKPQYLGQVEKKNVLTADFDEIIDKSPDLMKISELCNSLLLKEPLLSHERFCDLDSISKEEWVLNCEQLFLSISNLCKTTDIILRIFKADVVDKAFTELKNTILLFIKIGLDFDCAISQTQPTFKIRHMKCGIRLAEAVVAHRYNGQVFLTILNNDINIPKMLLDIYTKDHMALSIRLPILKALDSCLSSQESIEHFMQQDVYPKLGIDFDTSKTGYQFLITIIQSDPLSRIKFALKSLIKKLNTFALLRELKNKVLELNERLADNAKTESSELTEQDIDFIIHAFDEIIHLYRTECFDLSQPKRFLPVSAQFDISKDCSNCVLLQFFSIHNLLEVCLFLLTCPSTCNNLVITSPIHDLIYELVHSYDGINYLYQSLSTCELIFKALLNPYSQQSVDDFIYAHDLNNYNELQIIGLEMAYRLKALYYIEALCDLQEAHIDENELTDRLQSLYCLSFGSVGKLAVSDVIVMGDNAQCLMEVFEHGKNKLKFNSIKPKSPAKSYAIDIIVHAVKFSANIPFLKKYGLRILNVAKDHEKFEPSVSTLLLEVTPYLKQLEKAILTGDDISECVETLKNSIENAADLSGELLTCLRILIHYCMSENDQKNTSVCETVLSEYIDLKFKYNILHLFSLDGVAHLTAILDKICSHFEQPSAHTSMFVSIRGLTLAQILVPCIKLIDEMLARVIRCRGSVFRDMSAAPILLKTYGLARSYPAGCIAYKTACEAAEASIRALLAYAQPAADDPTDGDSIRRGPWTSLCSEVISYTMTAPYTFVTGLLAFSELLPLPLPLQAKIQPTESELADAANERRLWSAHLYTLTSELTDMIQTICVSSYQPVVHMLRRVCVQIADLAANTALTVARATLGAVAKETPAGKPVSASAARVLSFLAYLVAHAPVKCAVIYEMAVPNPKSIDIASIICNILKSGNSTDASAQEYAAHVLAGLCDAEVTLILPSAPLETLIANTLPSPETLSNLLEATADYLETSQKSSSVTSSILRAYFVVTEHEFGFHQFRKLLSKRKNAFSVFFKWVIEAGSEEKAECLSIYLEFVRILVSEEGETESAGKRRSMLVAAEAADLVGYTPAADHPVSTLEATLKERGADDEAISNAAFVARCMTRLEESEGAGAEAAAAAGEGPTAGVAAGGVSGGGEPMPLVEVWAKRARVASGGCEERLTAAYWLHAPASDAHLHDLAHADLACMDLRVELEGGEAGEGSAGGVGDKGPYKPSPVQPYAAYGGYWGGGRGARGGGGGAGGGTAPESGDVFRSRPPNTSRPPSLHVDDFTALERAPYVPQPHHHHQHPALRGMRRGGGGGGGGVAPGDRGRFVPHPHYRHMRGSGGGGGGSRGGGGGGGSAAWEAGALSAGYGAAHQYPPPPPPSHYPMGGGGVMGGAWGGGGRLQRPHRHRTFMR